MSNGQGRDGHTPPSDPDALRREIAETREQLGDTVQALAAKVDVKAQARRKVAESKEQARQKVAEGTELARQRVAEGRETLLATTQRARQTALEAYRDQPGTVVGGATAAVGTLVLYLIWRARR